MISDIPCALCGQMTDWLDDMRLRVVCTNPDCWCTCGTISYYRRPMLVEKMQMKAEEMHVHTVSIHAPNDATSE